MKITSLSNTNLTTTTHVGVVLVLLTGLLAGLAASPAHAVTPPPTITVTNNLDSGSGSLRQAIADVSSGGTINFDNDYTITLASQLDIVYKTVTITGAGHHITISGNNAVRIFHVGQSGGSGNLTIDHLNIINGASKVEECAGSAVACGGGLMLEYLTTATVLNSTFSNNDGGMAGGAIYSYYGHPLTVTNTTFINNHAVAYAGAIEAFYGIANLTNNTFLGNISGAYGSTLLNTWGTVTLTNNIFVKGATSVNACDNDFSDGGSTNDGGGNVRSGDNTCVGITADPMLGTLGDYGGVTPTYPLLPGSPVINAAGANCPAVDARGISRGATCDSGAFESQGFTLTKTSGDNQSTLFGTAFTDPLALTVTSAFGEPVDGGKVALTAPSSGASLTTTSYSLTISGGSVSQNVTANSTTGIYTVTASAAGATSVGFSLKNHILSTITWSNPADIVYGTALGATQLNATANTPGAFTYTPAAGTVLTVGPHTLHVDFVPTDTANYSNASKDVSITVTQATPVITWSNPAKIPYGTPLSATQLNASNGVAGTFTYDPVAGTVLDVGFHNLHVDFVPTDTTNYTNASKDVTIKITKATPVITWNDPANIMFGTVLGATQLNATANVPGAFTYTPGAGSVLTVGPHILHVDFVPTDTVHYVTNAKDVNINVIEGGFYSLQPCRILDTRATAAPLTAHEARVIAAVGSCGIVSEARAIAINVSVVNGTATGDLNIIPGNLADTGTSLISIPISRSRASNGVIQLATDGAGTIKVINNSDGIVHLILDVYGYFQ